MDIMSWFSIVAIFVVALINEQMAHEIHSAEFIEVVQSKAKTWKAGRNFPPNSPLPGTMIEDYDMGSQLFAGDMSAPAGPEITIPDHFDAREEWKNCPTIHTISDQFHCGSCWAHCTAGVMSDRYCIHSNQTKNFRFSSNDLLTCSNCGSCSRGNHVCALLYYKTHGVVSGGDYGSEEGCSPYEIKKDDEPTTPKCTQKCQPNYAIPYEKDKKFGHTFYVVQYNNATQDTTNIQIEIMTKGPVPARYAVYDDFYLYQSGVYQYTHGERKGYHAVRIIGWGVEDGTPYWLVANSWGNEWGEKGFFKILRGSNHLGIEVNIIGIMPKYE